MRRINVARLADEPFFLPWMGQEYLRKRDLRVAGDHCCCDGLWHVMGESHYGAESDQDPLLTAQVVSELAFAGYRFFDTILEILEDGTDWSGDRSEAWSSYAYSNFVQDVLPDADRRPHIEHWERARACFFGQLALTRPKQLLVVGRQAWDNLPTEGFTRLSPFQLPDEQDVGDAGLYAYDLGHIVGFTLATWVYHPSSRGLLNVEPAKSRVRSLAKVGCNILSDIHQDDGGFVLPADRVS